MKKIILASGSPRRKDLLDKYGVKYKVITSNTDEEIHEGDTPSQIVMSLAFQKALNVGLNHKEDIVIAADTMVFYDKKPLGKPKDLNEAREMLQMLNGKTHKVLTGICLINIEDNIKVVDYETTHVKFRKVSDAKIENYLETEEALDKAGSYGIQGIGGLLVEKIEGSYNNVIGLPVSLLDELLENYFNISIL